MTDHKQKILDYITEQTQSGDCVVSAKNISVNTGIHYYLVRGLLLELKAEGLIKPLKTSNTVISWRI